MFVNMHDNFFNLKCYHVTNNLNSSSCIISLFDQPVQERLSNFFSFLATYLPMMSIMDHTIRYND